ncbi:hypothetical protein ABZ479_35600 [Streptomyces sp. NPDC005722]
MRASDRSALLPAGLLATAGTAHFVVPLPFDAIVPRVQPGAPRTWTHVSGAAELTLAVGIAPRTRRASARPAAGFFTAVLPANVKMARDRRDRPAPLWKAAWARLPLRAPLVLWALKASRDSRP